MTKTQPNRNQMKPLLFTTLLSIFLTSWTTLASDDLQGMAGKWSVKKTNDQGEKYTQTIEVKNDKFIFQIVGSDDQVTLHAEGDLKLERLGPFSSVRFFHIRAGGSASDLREVDDEYVSVYVLDGDTWTLASNFDKQREQKPSVDVYRRLKAPAAQKPSRPASARSSLSKSFQT
jgi:hypothetical protein